MDYYHNGTLYAEQVDLAKLANDYGTPCYVYSRAALEQHWQAFDQALHAYPHLVCYAVKANSNLAVLQVLAQLGSGFDIVSGGELERVLRAGGKAHQVVFSGVGKTTEEIRRALEVGILTFNVESPAELWRLNQVAGAMGRRAPMAVRVNPDVDANTHPYISTGLKENKFGLDLATAYEIYQQATTLPHIQIVGIACHIGSQLTTLAPLVDAWQRVRQLVEKLRETGIFLQHLDVGGGLGVRYRDETPPSPQDYVAALAQVFKNQPVKILLEPGRAIAANAGVLLTKVEYLKATPHKHFAVVDAGMNDLLRPSLYQAWHEILPVLPRSNETAQYYDIVGPICETGDFLGKERFLALREGDLLAVRSCGAYGFVMSSQYNTRPRAVELMVDGNQITVIRRRETITDLLNLESIIQ